MTRQKSNRTLLIEQERAARKEERERKKAEKERDKKIREDRHEQKQAEREAKREARLKKQLTHESVERNGVPRVRDAGAQLGVRDAMEYSQHVLCEGCHQVIREKNMIGALCERCHYSKEVESEKPTSMGRANRAVPGKGDGGNKQKGLEGQLTLLI